ncbi:EamA family transporter [Bradyrhizobium liaoningense]|uniref:EamA family transporter n=1 Tax=Bradyrhizobium liaoningense TaxID=43992 RepID=UPI001BAD0A5C|nr:EamA family transporter [Bradyrhizobium liaoningense]MBR0906647.1 EamA family transporter [Bradyrhizobium liaoningense]
MKQQSSILPIVAAFAAIYVIWGSTYLALAFALQSFPPFLLMAARCLVGGAVLYGSARAMGDAATSGGTLPLAAVCGMLFFVGCHGVLAYVQERVPSGLAAVLLATIPLWIALLQFLMPGGERPDGKAALLLVPGVAGVALIAWHGDAAGGQQLSLRDTLLLLGASFSWAAATFISVRHTPKGASIGLSGLELLIGGVVLLAISVCRGELSDHRLAVPSAVSIAGWAYLTIAGTVAAFAANVWLLERVSPTLVATYTFVNPIIAVLLGFAFLGEEPTRWMLVGTALIVVSIAGVLHGQHKRKEERIGSKDQSAVLRAATKS